MAIRLNQEQLDWISSEYQSGRSIQEISIDTGVSISNVKRALAETQDLSLDWYKTTHECEMIHYLQNKGIKTLNQLKEIC